MLGVQRSGVSIAAALLKKAGLIEYTRGNITVTDRSGLEGAACECYAVLWQMRQHTAKIALYVADCTSRADTC